MVLLMLKNFSENNSHEPDHAVCTPWTGRHDVVLTCTLCGKTFADK